MVTEIQWLHSNSNGSMEEYPVTNGMETTSSTSSSTPWWTQSTACYHEPIVHDHELYFLLANINVYVLLPVAVIGTLINATALVALHRPPKITSGVFVYLKALLVLDICQLTVTTLTHLLPQICAYHHNSSHALYDFCTFERRFLKYTMPRIEMTVNVCHIWTIAGLAAHRYWKISRPVVARLKDTVHRAKIILVFLLMAAIVFRLPTFAIELQVKFRNGFQITRIPWATEFLSLYRFMYHSVLDPLCSNVLPFIWMTVFSLLTLKEICKSRHFAYNQLSFDGAGSVKATPNEPPVPVCFRRRRSDGIRQKHELRATVSIILMIVLYLIFHFAQLYNVVRKWQLLLNGECPTRSDYIQSHLSLMLSLISASVNAFVFIAFTNRLKRYVKMLIRKTSRTLSNSSDPPLSPRSTTTDHGVMTHQSSHDHPDVPNKV